MAWKNLKQLSLADSLTSEYEALTELDDVNELIDWQAIEHLLCDTHAKRRGNIAWPSVFMFKALLLQSWYNLSDASRSCSRSRLYLAFPPIVVKTGFDEFFIGGN